MTTATKMCAYDGVELTDDDVWKKVGVNLG
jgi:hypothetical protein